MTCGDRQDGKREEGNVETQSQEAEDASERLTLYHQRSAFFSSLAEDNN